MKVKVKVKRVERSERLRAGADNRQSVFEKRWIRIGAGSLTAALKEMMAMSDDECRAMDECGRTWIECDLSWQGIGLKMRKVYEWLLRADNRPEWMC